MTPTLYGRWQTRLLLFTSVGAIATLFFSLGIAATSTTPYFALLFWLCSFGFVWDILYTFLQKWRWDRDWPAVFQLLAGLWEALFIVFIINVLGISLPGIGQTLDLGVFAFHYSVVWLSIFVASQSLMRIFFPRWRFRGGKWL